MVESIHLYVEGGGDSNQTRIKLRQGFSQFLGEIISIAREKRVRWNITACGSRNEAYDDFCIAVKTRPNVLNILLVDSEIPCSLDSVWDFLKQNDHWDCPINVGDSQCFLMAQSMEAWLIVDRAALKHFYGDGLLLNNLPKTTNVETIGKDALISSLEKTTVKTVKGKYAKNHAFGILEKVDAKIVRSAAPQCARLFDTLKQLIGD